MFQKYRMKYVPNSLAPGRTYRYKNLTIVCTKDEGSLTASICPHGFNPTLPEKEEVDGILLYLGINPDAPMEHFTVEHYGDPTFGDTRYYVQELSHTKAS